MTKQQQILIACGIVVVGVMGLLLYHRKRMVQYTRGLMNVSYFTIDELCASSTAEQHGIDNAPSEAVKKNLLMLRDRVLDPVRRAYGSYIRVTSGYRCEALNALLGGAASSQHTKGEATDITGGSVGNNREIFAEIVRHGVFDQLIWEKGGQWVHVSSKAQGVNRREILNYSGGQYTNITHNWREAIKYE